MFDNEERPPLNLPRPAPEMMMCHCPAMCGETFIVNAKMKWVPPDGHTIISQRDYTITCPRWEAI